MPVPRLPSAGVDWSGGSDLTPPPAPVIPYLDYSGLSPAPWYDFSGWLEKWFPQPGPVIQNPQKGHPVPAPGNPPEQGGSQQSGIAGQVAAGIQSAIQPFLPSTAQKRDIAVYGLALIVFVIAVASILR